jgi:hypothetical protein
MSETHFHHWTDRDGREWACLAYDHGPLCRLCREVTDGVESACLANVDKGYFDVRGRAQDPVGEWQFQVTESGKRYIAALLNANRGRAMTEIADVLDREHAVVFDTGATYHLARPNGSARCNVGGRLGEGARPYSTSDDMRGLRPCIICARRLASSLRSEGAE